MLEFFRKNQRIFFVITTVIIVLSFSFFGTYQAFSQRDVPKKLAFETPKGRKVYAHEVEAYKRFLSTDVTDRFNWGNIWGPNFLNDGFLVNQFFKTGLAIQIAEPFIENLKGDFVARFERQKQYLPYVHPHVPYINAETIWQIFAPELINNMRAIQALGDDIDIDSLRLQVALYLEERKFPPPYLSRILHYQESQYSQAPSDPRMQNLNLYGYHTTEDWFGSKWIYLAVQFLIDTAEIAKESGFTVSDEEAKADLLYQAEQLAIHENGPESAKYKEGYFQEQLKYMGMDAKQAVAIWRDVLMFRRLFENVGHSVFQENLSFKKFAHYAAQKVDLDVYHLLDELRFHNFDDLQKWEIYTKAVYEPKDPLSFPVVMKPMDDIERDYPELASKKIKIALATCSKTALQLRVSLKETWDWLTEETNWTRMQMQFPQWGVSFYENRQAAWNRLEQLDEVQRRQCDIWAKQQIVSSHPEWIEEALTSAQVTNEEFRLRTKGGELALKGINDRAHFIRALEGSALSQRGDAPSMALYTQDNDNFYRIWIENRDDEKSLLSFKEAKSDNTLDLVLQRELEGHYSQLRAKNPSLYLLADGSFKPLEEVKMAIAGELFYPLLEAIQKDAAMRGLVLTDDRDLVASHRFFKIMSDYSAHLDSEEPAFAFKDKRTYTRKELDDSHMKKALAMEIGSVSSVNQKTGDLYFFHINSKDLGEDNGDDLVDEVYKLTGLDAERALGAELVNRLIASLRQPDEEL